MIDGQLIADIATGLVGTSLMILLGKSRQKSLDDRLSIEDRQEFPDAFRRWRLIEGPIVLCGMIIAALAWFFFLNTLASFSFARQNLGTIVVTPDPAYWGLIAVFLGIASFVPIVDVIIKKLLGDRYAIYCELLGAERGRKSIQVMEALIYPTAVVAILIGFRTYTAFGETGATFQAPLWAEKQTYPYDRIRRLARVVPPPQPDAAREDLNSYAIRFDDGFTWTTRMFLRDPDDKRDPAILEFVAARCGRPIRVISSLDEFRP